MIKINNKSFSIIFLMLVMLFSIIFYYGILKQQREYYNTHHISIHGFYLMDSLPLTNFKLTDMYGKEFTKDDFKNHWTLLYFGFTHCKIICPTTMTMLNQTYQILRSKLNIKTLPTVAFITIDPNRDTLSIIRKFVEPYGSGFIGLRADMQMTIDIENQFHVSVSKIPEQKNQSMEYVLNHGVDILLINPEAKIQAYFTYPQKPKELANDYAVIVNKYPIANGHENVI